MRVLGLWIALWLISLNSSRAESTTASELSPAVDPSALSEWWKAAGKVRLSDTVYRIDPEKQLNIRDGVCSAELRSGFLVPVITGQAPVSERIVGYVFSGDGQLDVRFPERGDAWAFANHMVTRAGHSTSEFSDIAHQRRPYRVGINQGLVLSADPKFSQVLLGLEPVGGGMVLTQEKGEMIGETYVVTSQSGRAQAKFTAVDVLAQRLDSLQQIGLDPRALLRQDRLMSEQLGFPGEVLRGIADFRTTDRFHVAVQGRRLSSMEDDKWMTCFRDGRDESEMGYRAVAFSYGQDGDQRRRFKRFSGAPFLSVDESKAPAGTFGFKAQSADVDIRMTPKSGGMYQRVAVETKLNLQATDRPLQYVALRLPTQGARQGSWSLEKLERADGAPIAWVGVNADLVTNGVAMSNQGAVPDSPMDAQQFALASQESIDETPDPVSIGGLESNSVGVDSTSISAENPLDSGTSRIDNPAQQPNFRLTPSEQTVSQSERLIGAETGFRYDIIALLPEPVAPGQAVSVVLNWSADWQFGNLSFIETPDGTIPRTLGATTGVHPVLPELLPIGSGTRWDYRLSMKAKKPWLRTQNLLVSGENVVRTASLTDQEVQSVGHSAISPSVGIGRWSLLTDPAAQGFPEIQVLLFPRSKAKASQFAPEIRRILAVYQRVLPANKQGSYGVYQDRALTVTESARINREANRYGLLKVTTISPTAIGTVGRFRAKDSTFSSTQLARQLAQQYWGQSVSVPESRTEWLLTALSDTMALYYGRTAFGREYYDQRITQLRASILRPTEESAAWKLADARLANFAVEGLTAFTNIPQRVSADYALYVLTEHLRLKLGNEAFFGAMQAAAQTDWVTTDRFRDLLEQSSGQQLDDFFDYWISGGFIPELSVEWRNTGPDAVGCIHSNIPFGVLEVPLRLDAEVVGEETNKHRVIDTTVQLVDGLGQFRVPKAHIKDVQLDPLQLMLSRDGGTVQRESSLTCEQKK